MKLIQEKDRRTLRQRFEKLQHPVKLVVFTTSKQPETSELLSQMAQELAEVSAGKITVEQHSLEAEPAVAQAYNITLAPAIVVRTEEKDYGIRYLGVPAGFEFASLVGAIEDVGTGNPGLSPDTRLMLANLRKPVHIRVFVTYTCPYCPAAVRLAHKLALASDLVTAEGISSEEFPELANQYGVMAVPKVVINDRHSFEGALPEPAFVQQVLRGAAGSGLIVVP
ncbi:MAG: thioredoxin family protein [Fimbriimonadales bacterium]|nr:thioredoxin family protein [Fimbriimonadales bacterium]MDW8051159.1 thioredoxin family protein [Armatimonadota bacterium]